MDLVSLGRTGLQVSVAGLGCGGRSRLGMGQGGSQEQATAVVKAALDLGVTVIDTASLYGTEAAVGAAVKGRRDKVVIATKLKVTQIERGDNDSALIDGAELTRRLEVSLGRLDTDYVDILYLHGVKPREYDHCVKVLLPTLVDLRASGKIRHFGMTEWFDFDLKHEALIRAVADGHWGVMMIGLNLLNQTALSDLLPAARAASIGVFGMYAVRGALARPAAVRELVAKLIASGEIDPADVDADDPLGFVVREGGARSVTDAAYRFCRYATGIDVVLTGTGNIAHLADNLRSIQAPPLPPFIVERLHKIFGRVASATGNEFSA